MFLANMHEAKTNLSKLVEKALQGEDVVIAKSGKPLARLVPFREKKKLRKPGSLSGKVWISDDFDAPLPPEFMKYFEGENG